ncbi:DNA alkylation repair protein [Candidatus Dojkabacteria bacterium]|nr:DNA alkylation repair protein [Candidatus Dojkabacteria bacterium]
MGKLQNLYIELEMGADKEDSIHLQRFFKTSKGEYGEGDIFVGIRIPQLRSLVKKYYKELTIDQTIKLLHSRFHEYRMLALLILVKKFEISKDPKEHTKIYNLYLTNTKYINNWDLVDVTTPNIVGKYLSDKNRKILYKLATSKNLWEQRMAILATATFIKNGEFEDTLGIAEILLNHPHDLIHKAVGWMLREVGKKDIKTLYSFLEKHSKEMPRTMLRYSLEKVAQQKKDKYMRKP